MPRKLRVEYPGAIYHVMSRGDRREDIFKDDVDRQDFLKTLAEACQKKTVGWIANRLKMGTRKNAASKLNHWGRHGTGPCGGTAQDYGLTPLFVEPRETIEEAIRFAQDLDVFSIQVSLAMPYPGTELYEMARQNGWFASRDNTDVVGDDGFQQSALEDPGCSKEEIFEAVDRFYQRWYFRPTPILRILRTMQEDRDVLVRPCREG